MARTNRRYASQRMTLNNPMHKEPSRRKLQATLRIDLKYSADGEPVIHGIERISRPGRRVYRNKQDIPRVLGGLGLAIVSTSKGVLAGHEAAKSGIGGEVLCQVW